jgi:fibronectin-binding autotransporter adhesin
MKKNRRRLVLWAGRAFSSFLATTLLSSSAAAQFLVNYNVGSPYSSLPAAVAYSNTLSGANTVSWASGAGGTSTLPSVLDVNGGTTLDATSAGSSVLIDGSQLSLTGGVTFANNAATTMGVSSTIEGAGSLTKTGAGVVSLSGDNTYTGGTILNTGILSITNDDNLGNASEGVTFNGGTLQTGAAVSSARGVSLNGTGTFDTNGYASLLSGVISGTGQLVIADSSAGGGVLTLTNTGNTYSGGTLLESGTLSIQSFSELGSGGLAFDGGALQTQGSLSSSLSLVLDSNGGSIDTAGSTTTLSGLISGVGALTKISTGTLVLTGANTYSGGTVVRGGVLAVYNEGNLGDAYGTITLDGGILQTRGDLLDIRNVFLGGSGGTIDTDGYDDDFYGVFSDSGSAHGGLTKIGAGILTLYGANTYSGGTAVSSGTLRIGADNVMPSGGALAIADGAVFDMNGYNQTNGLGNVVNNGLFNVGSGRLALSGSYSGTGTLQVTLLESDDQNDPSYSAATHVANITGGSLVLTGGTLSVKTTDPAVKSGDTFTVISGAAIGGTFAGVTSPAAVNFAPTYNAGSLVLTAELVPFASLGATANQTAVAGALESLRAQAQSNPGGDAGSVIGSLYALNKAQIQDAFDQIGPIALASMSSLGLAGSNAQAEALGRRMTALDDGSNTSGVSLNSVNGVSGKLFAEGGVDDADPFGRRFQPENGPDSPWGFFASGTGTKGHLSSIQGSAGEEPGYSFTSGGIVFGGDYRLSDALAVGLVGGYLYGQANVYSDAESAVNDNSARGGVYATGREGAFRADLYAGGAMDFFSTNRGILFGTTSEAATAHPTGDEINANGYFTYDFDTAKHGTLSPFFGINADRLMIHSFSEKGAGALDLDVGGQTAQSLRSSLGLRQTKKVAADGVTYQWHWSLGWVHEFLDQSRPIDAQLSAGGSAFTVDTASQPSDGALAGAGVVVSVDRDTSVNLDYSADIRPRFAENVIQASLRLKF